MFLPNVVLPAHAQITGGPIIDASIYGNKEFYPGQTAPLFVVVQNKGYLESLYGMKTQESVFNLDGVENSASEDLSASTTSSLSSNIGSSSTFTNQSAGLDLSSQAGWLENADAQSTASISDSSTRINDNFHVADTIGGVEHNTQDSVETEVATALGLVCQLTSGNAPVDVVTGDRGIVGSLAPGQVGGGPTTLYTLSFGLYQPLNFWIRVDSDAKPGHYTIPLVCTYKQLIDDYSCTSMDGAVVRQKNYVERTEVIPLEIVIMPRFDLMITNVVTTEMVPDTNGYITMTVTNMDNLSVTQAVAFLMQPKLGSPQDEVSSNYPLSYEMSSFLSTTLQQPQTVTQNMVVPLQNSQYLGDMAPGESCNVTFKVSVSKDAETSNIPMSVVVSYRDPWDQLKSSNTRSFGIHVQPEMIFDVNTDPIRIKSGQSTNTNLTLTNAGTETARTAVVRMNALDPFTVSYDTTYLGDVAPGQTVNTTFGIKVKQDAVPTDYYVTMEVKYYDSHNDPHITKIIRKEIIVLPPSTIWDMILENWWLILILALLLLLGLAYFGYKKLKRKPPAGGKPPEAAGQPSETVGQPTGSPETPGSAGKPPESAKTDDLWRYMGLLVSRLDLGRHLDLLESRLDRGRHLQKEKTDPSPMAKGLAKIIESDHSSTESHNTIDPAPFMSYSSDGSGGTTKTSTERKEHLVIDSVRSGEIVESDHPSADSHMIIGPAPFISQSWTDPGSTPDPSETIETPSESIGQSVTDSERSNNTTVDPTPFLSLPPPDHGPPPDLSSNIRFWTRPR